MSGPEDRLQRALQELDSQAQPPAGWQARVWQASEQGESVVAAPAPASATRWLATAAVALSVLVMLLGGTLLWQMNRYEAREQEAAELAEQSRLELERKLSDLMLLTEERDRAYQEMLQDSDQDQRARLQRAIDGRNELIARKKSEVERLRKKGRPAMQKVPKAKREPKSRGMKVSCDPNEPLCGN